LANELKARRQSLLEFEGLFGFGPGGSAEALEQLRHLVKP
jgi:hypothetical protein